MTEEKAESEGGDGAKQPSLLFAALAWVLSLPKVLFGFREPVRRPTYIVLGLALTALKYEVERAWFRDMGHSMGIADFFTPVFARDKALFSVPYETGVPATWLAAANILLALPFLWVGFSLSSRRAMAAKLTPLYGFLFFVPVVQFGLMAVLAALPSRAPDVTHVWSAPPPNKPAHALQAWLMGVLVGCAGIAWTSHDTWRQDSVGPVIGSAILGALVGLVTLAASTWSARDLATPLVTKRGQATREPLAFPTSEAASPRSRRMGCLYFAIGAGALAFVAPPLLVMAWALLRLAYQLLPVTLVCAIGSLWVGASLIGFWFPKLEVVAIGQPSESEDDREEDKRKSKARKRDLRRARAVARTSER